MAAKASAGTLLRRRLSKNVAWDERELEVLRIAVDLADRIESLEALIDEQGLSVRGSTGQIRVNPLVTEARLSRVSLARMLSELRIPDASGVAKDPAKRRAALTMHGTRAAARGAGRLQVVGE